MQKPFAIAIDSNDKVYLSELSQDRVKIFKVDGEYEKSFGAKGTEEGQFRDIGSISFNGSHNTMIISDSFNNRLQIFNV